ncbi:MULTISPECIES: hypothetical protein [Cupriavidus]|uniref:hypothetical protein n=1 Tax=Cupriavidus TaxID=106589 RepID=UPI0025A86D6C|nr:hypothetical protein [Cupriavidus sp. TKC]GMG91429.1 hypothetical protein Cmtc_26490 [Cupriavidus sp. TKC]
MKKPTPKQDAQKGDAKKETGGKTNAQTLNKALDIGKSLVSTGSNLIDLGKEVERTKQAQIKADAEVEGARQVTERHRLAANVAHDEIARRREKDNKDFQTEMARLAIERDDKASQNRMRESLIDGLVKDPGTTKAQIVDTYRALLNNDKNQ